MMRGPELELFKLKVTDTHTQSEGVSVREQSKDLCCEQSDAVVNPRITTPQKPLVASRGHGLDRW